MAESSVQTKIILLLGRKGTGKTTWIQKCIKKIQGKKTILIVDTIKNFDNIADIELKNSEELYQLIRLKDYEKKIIRVVPRAEFGKYEAVKLIYLAYLAGNFTIVFDEGHAVFHQSMDVFTQEIVRQGRNQGIDLIVSSLRPVSFHPDLRAQTDEVIIFALKGKKDVQFVADEFGADAIRELIYKLKGHQYIRFSCQSQKYTLYAETRAYNRTGKYKGVHADRKKKRKEGAST